MIIRECVYVNNRDALSKSRYLNKLIIQEEREYRAHLLLDITGYFRVNREKIYWWPPNAGDGPQYYEWVDSVNGTLGENFAWIDVLLKRLITVDSFQG